jgi:hypothetical protein
MSEIALPRINSFARVTEQANVQHSEEPVFILTSNQLEDIVKQAVHNAIEYPKDLHQIVKDQAREIEALNTKLETMQKDMGSLAENQYNQLRLIAALRKKEPRKTETARAEKIAQYLKNRPDHKASFESLKGFLGVDKVLLNQAIKTLMDSEPGRYGITQTLGDKRKRTIAMIPR